MPSATPTAKPVTIMETSSESIEFSKHLEAYNERTN